MEIGEVKKGDFVVLTPVGKLDTKTAGEFERKLLEMLNGGQRRFVVDLISLEHLSSAGLRVLLMLGKKLGGTEDGHLALCNLNQHVQEVFDIAGFSSVFTICPSLDQALASGPTASKTDQALERVAKALGATSSPHPPPPAGGDDDVVARAAKLLGAKVGKKG